MFGEIKKKKKECGPKPKTNYYKLHPKNIIDFFTHNNSHGNNVDRTNFLTKNYSIKQNVKVEKIKLFYFYVQEQTMALVKSPSKHKKSHNFRT